MAADFRFKKAGIDRFTTTMPVYDTMVEVIVTKNGNRWIAKANYTSAAADTKRFATLHLQQALRKQKRA